MISERQVRIIPARPRAELLNRTETKKPIICAYARVSTEREEQEDSYSRQIDYYTKLIKARSDWEFGGMYADHGITGTKSEVRPEFMKMINDARNGTIDRILVKNISRFSRNTVDTIKYIRELREKGVGITFESENIDTLTSGGEVLIAILAALAEQESRTLGCSVRWGMQRKFMKGEVMLNWSRFLGYRKNEKGNLEIIESEAEIVRRIYREFLNGYSTSQIANGLTKDGVPTIDKKNPGEKQLLKVRKREGWYPTTIRSILCNEKYKGCCLFQKSFKPELTGSRKINNGEVQSVYVEDSHPAIISKNTFEMVQAEYKRRKNIRSGSKTGEGRYSGKYALSGMLYCNTCGSRYRRYAKYNKNGENIPLWVCNTHKIRPKECSELPVEEQSIINGYLTVVKQLAGQSENLKEVLFKNIEEVIITENEKQIEVNDIEISKIQAEMMTFYKDKEEGTITEKNYIAKEKEISEKIEQLTEQKNELEKKNNKLKLSKYRIEEIMGVLNNLRLIEEFDDNIFKAIVEKIKILSRTTIRIYFKCGIEKETELF